MKSIDYRKAFDLFKYALENTGEDYVFDQAKNITLTPDQQRKVIQKTIQSFIMASATLQEGQIIQAFSGSSDLPQLTKDVFNVQHVKPIYDTLWSKCYNTVQLQKGQLSWEIADVDSGISFEKIAEGESVKTNGVSGNLVTANVAKYGAALGFTWEMFEANKLYQFVQKMDIVKAKLNQLWADVHYGLLVEAGEKNREQKGSGSVVDVLNRAGLRLATANKDKGYGDTANMPFELYFSPTVKNVVLPALEFKAENTAGETRKVVYDMNVNLTFNSSLAPTRGLLVLPGHKIQNAVYLQELRLQHKDVFSLADVETFWTVFGAIVADTDQVVEINFSSTII